MVFYGWKFESSSAVTSIIMSAVINWPDKETQEGRERMTSSMKRRERGGERWKETYCPRHGQKYLDNLFPDAT